jgi:hypothetical protein
MGVLGGGGAMADVEAAAAAAAALPNTGPSSGGVAGREMGSMTLGRL